MFDLEGIEQARHGLKFRGTILRLAVSLARLSVERFPQTGLF